MILAIADPPYPPSVSVRFDLAGGAGRRVERSRARRYYGDGTRCATEKPADFHPDAAEWDAPARHRQLVRDLMDMADGWAIATTPDGLAAYGELPVGRLDSLGVGRARPPARRHRARPVPRLWRRHRRGRGARRGDPMTTATSAFGGGVRKVTVKI